MRPIQLDLHGFAAFREPTRVDFAGAEYFALVGPTGSGKSTVIDAMTFALYGSVPRWDDRKIVHLALAPTATRGTVRLVFEVGATRYVVARELRRGANDKVTVRNARLERLLDPADPEGETEPVATESGVSRHVEELLGLPFDQFCQCVVLPQGDFAAFLHAKPADRQETLTRILGLGIYRSIQQRAGTEAATARQRAEVITGELGRYTDADQAALDAAWRRADALSALAERVAVAVPALADAERSALEATRAAERVRTEIGVLAGLRPPVGLAALAADARLVGERVGAARAVVTAAEAADTGARAALAAAPDPGPLRQLRRDHAELTGLRAEGPGLGAALARARDAVVAAHTRTAAAAAALDGARAAEAAAATARDTVHAEAARLADELARLAVIRMPTEVTGLTGELSAAAERSAGARAAAAAAEDTVDQARVDQAGAARALTAARAELDQLVRLDQAAALRAELVAGHDCPVCEQPVRVVPPIPTTSELPAARQVLATATVEHDRLAAAVDDATAALAGARVAAQRADVAHTELVARVQRLAADLRAARDPLVALGAPASGTDLMESWTELVGWTGSAAAERSRQLAGLDRDGADAAHTSAVRAVREAAGAVERCRGAETGAVRAEHDARRAAERAETRSVELVAALAGAPTDAEAADRLDELAELRVRATAADTALRDARARLTEAASGAERVGAALRTGWRELDAARDPLVGLGAPALDDQAIAGRRAEAAGAAAALVDGWRALTDWAARVAGERRAGLPAAEAAVRAAAAAVSAAEQSLIGDLRAHELRLGDGRPLAAEAPVLVAAAYARARAGAERLAERWDEARRLAEQHDDAQQAHQVATTLARLLRSNEFPRWLVASALDTLVADASSRLAELSGGQFELTHEAGEFLVVDHADADTRRPVKTLSGGETFQASLALALALSEQLSTLAAAGAARLDSIFLDEGFGTLDEANLEIVAATLENLAAVGDRMVGVVTHVPALAERVPVRFVVSRDQRTSSIVREGG